MISPPVPTRLRVLRTLFASVSLSSLAGLPTAIAYPLAAYPVAGDGSGDASYDDGFAYESYQTDASSRPPGAPARESLLATLQFATADDAQALEDIAARVSALTPPDASEVARAFIREQLGIDGDDYVIAHFGDAGQRRRGRPDHTVPLLDAVMEAFPEQAGYSTFATVADLVGGINAGARSPSIVQLGEHIVHAQSASSVFTDALEFLWSRTGPGYLYMTLFAKGNVIQTAEEEWRDVDEAFGIFRTGGFTAAHESPIRLSHVLAQFGAPRTFAELPYITRLHEAQDRYWRENKADWALLARYQFVLRARVAHATGQLSDGQYELVMRGGAPRVPLAGPISLHQLREASRDPSVRVQRFDINGYTASNIVRFKASDGGEVMYVPGLDPSFVAVDSESALRQWVLDQAKDPHALEAVLSHFSVYDSQDGVFWTGVRHGLEKIGNGQWRNDGRAIDHRNAAIEGDVFDDMRASTERRVRDDARVRTRNAWETWRVGINRGAALLSPLGFVRPLVVPVQVAMTVTGVGTGIEQGVDGRTQEERKQGFEQAGVTLVSTGLIAGGLAGKRNPAPEPLDDALPERPFFQPPQRINGRVGYLAGPVRAPRFPGAAGQLYVDATGRIARWAADDYVTRTLRRAPKGAKENSQGILELGPRKFVKLKTGRVAEVMHDGGGYRVQSRSRVPGPRIVPDRDGRWELAFADDNHLPGSYLSNIADGYSIHPETLHRAGLILEQFASSETALRDAKARELGPLAQLSIGHAFLETLPARLRDGLAISWTQPEIELLLPLLTKEYARPIALFHADGSLRLGLRPDGSEFDMQSIPANTIRLSYLDGHYNLADASAPATTAWYSVFQLIGKATGASAANVQWEPRIRARLADILDSRSTREELDLLHRRWIDPMKLPAGRKQALEALSYLRHALVDRRAGLSAEQRATLAAADKGLRDTLIPGEPDPYPRLSDVLARISDPRQPRSDADMGFLMTLLARIAGEQDALLPRGLDHLLVKSGPGLAGGATTDDQWTVAGRHYVRLRHLDGRTQVVETESPDRGDYLQILAPGDGPGRGSGRFVVALDGGWFPEEGVREGLVLMPPVTDLQAFVSVDVRPPAAMEEDFGIIERMVNSIPQPMLRLLGTSLPEAVVTPEGAVSFTVRSPVTGVRVTFPTYLDMAGQPVPRPWRAALVPDALTMAASDPQLVMPVPDGTARSVPSDASAYLTMLRDERPISAFVEAGFGDRHIKVLAQTRRLRGLLREDGHVAVVGATPEHAFTLVMPAGADSLGFVSTGAAGGRNFWNLPVASHIVDPMYGVNTTAAEYPTAIRAVARRWEAEGVSMKRIQRDGSETRESPVAFTERVLSSRVQANLWNPAGDPISEIGYVRYMRRLYESNGSLRHAGLDWLGHREARRDYMSYFARPYDTMPTWDAPSTSGTAAAKTLYDLARTAVQVLAPPGSPPAM